MELACHQDIMLVLFLIILYEFCVRISLESLPPGCRSIYSVLELRKFWNHCMARRRWEIGRYPLLGCGVIVDYWNKKMCSYYLIYLRASSLFFLFFLSLFFFFFLISVRIYLLWYLGSPGLVFVLMWLLYPDSQTNIEWCISTVLFLY